MWKGSYHYLAKATDRYCSRCVYFLIKGSAVYISLHQNEASLIFSNHKFEDNRPKQTME